MPLEEGVMSLWMLPSALVVALLVLGPLLARLEWVPPFTGFLMFLGGTLLAIVSAVAFSGAAGIASALGKVWRGRALRAAIVPLVAMIAILLSQSGTPRPPFNDVTTDLDDPPRFQKSPKPDEGYPQEWRALHRDTYGSLAPIELALEPGAAYARVVEVARAMPAWEIVAEDPASGTLEAVATSSLFRFRDDVAIRVRPSAGGARVDVRSRSRVGLSDQGANARRIDAFLSAVRARAAAR
jgi:uncharacterized protein (DUF1499 family)